MSRVGIYARVSKDDRSQDPINQVFPIREWCARHGHVIVAEFVDYETGGGKKAATRPEFLRLFQVAESGGFDLAVCWSLDRWSRQGMVATVTTLERLAKVNVGFHSLQEPMISTADEMTRDILIAVISTFAKAERLRISARTKAGLDKVRVHGSKSGKPIGRPGLAADKVRLIRHMAGDGADKHVIARAAGVHWKTVEKYAV